VSFVSYAQNFEDVMLWRALKHVPKGFYVDVGAQHPVVDSVSQAFYERGWRGVHIEPVPQYAELLRKARPDETVLQVALADTDGVVPLNVIANTGLSTAIDAYAQLYQEQEKYQYQRIVVPALTLNSALRPLAFEDIHWLKIDVEGFEEQVLKGWDSTSLRPWIIVVEATIPLSKNESYGLWEPTLVTANYKFVYFDGLNRFYVANEHAELGRSFSCPPNFFDNIAVSDTSWLAREVTASHRSSLQLAKEETRAARAQAADLEVRLTAVLRSTSWRLTQPLRLLARLFRRDPMLKQWMAWRVKQAYSGITAFQYACRRKIKTAVKKRGREASLNPAVRRVSARMLAPFPTLKARLRLSILGSSPQQPSMPSARLVGKTAHVLSLRGGQVFLDLEQARLASEADRQRTGSSDRP
jgi:FkbM family methyltransferase